MRYKINGREKVRKKDFSKNLSVSLNSKTLHLIEMVKDCLSSGFDLTTEVVPSQNLQQDF